MGGIIAKERKLVAEQAIADAKLRDFIKKRRPSFLLAGEPVGISAQVSAQKDVRERKARENKFLVACIAGRTPNAQDAEGFSALHLACKLADLEKVTLVLKLNPDVNLPNRFLWTPLHTAVFNGSISILEKILSANADVSLAENYGLTVFHIVACSPRLYAIENVFKGYQRERRKARRAEFKRHLSSLTSSNAVERRVTVEDQESVWAVPAEHSSEYASTAWKLEPNRIELIVYERLALFKTPLYTTLQELLNKTDKKRRTPLMYVARYGNHFMCSRLIHDDANLELTDLAGDTALHYAVRYLNSPVVQILLMALVNVNAINLMGETPLHLAVIAEDSFITSALLVVGADVNLVDSHGKSPLLLAMELKLTSIFSQLILYNPDLKFTDEQGWTCAIRAVHSGLLLELLPLLLLPGDNENVILARDSMGMNVLHHALEVEKEDYVRAIYTSRVGKALLVADYAGNSPLHFASAAGSIVNLNLISHDYSDLDICNNAGETPVMLAARSGKMANVIALINVQRHLVAADSSLIDKNGLNLFMHACVSGNADLVRFILANDDGSNSNLSLTKVKVNQPDIQGRTGLSLAAENGRWEVIGVLVLSDASVATKDRDGWSPLHYAVNSGDSSTVAALLDCEANIDEVDGQGWTPLIHAVVSDNVPAAQILIDRGADTSIRSNEGMTALEYLASHRTKRSDDMMNVLTDGMRNHMTRLGLVPGETVAVSGHFEITVKTLEGFYLAHPRKYAIFACIMFKTEQSQPPIVHFTSAVLSDSRVIDWHESHRIDVLNIDSYSYLVIELFAAHRREPLTLDSNLIADDLGSSNHSSDASEHDSEHSSSSDPSEVSTDHDEAMSRRPVVDRERKQLRIFQSCDIPWPPIKASHIPMGFVIVPFRTLREATNLTEPLQLTRRLRAAVSGHLSFDLDFRFKQAGYPDHPRLISSRPATPDAAAMAAFKQWQAVTTEPIDSLDVPEPPIQASLQKSQAQVTRSLVAQVVQSSIKMSS